MVAKKSVIYNEPSDVRAMDGHVYVIGPNAVDVALSAEETSERLLYRSMKARGQRRLKRNPHQPQE